MYGSHVDFWNLAKAPLRRWYVAAPLLLLSIALVALSASSVRPEYDAVGHLLLVPPVSAGQPADHSGVSTSPVVRNPWEDLGLLALSRAAVVEVESRKAGLAANGYTSDVTLTVGYPTPVISIEAIGTSARQAADTVAQVEKLLAGEVAAAQARYGVAAGGLITTLSLDGGDNVTTSRSKLIRVTVLVGVAGLLFTAAMTGVAEALLRRRTRTADLGVGTLPTAPARLRRTPVRRHRPG